MASNEASLDEIPEASPEEVRRVLAWTRRLAAELQRVAVPLAAALERDLLQGAAPRQVSFAELVNIVHDRLDIDSEEGNDADELAEMADSLVTPDVDDARTFTCGDLVGASVAWIRDAAQRLETGDPRWVARAALPVEAGGRALVVNFVALGQFCGLAQLVAPLSVAVNVNPLPFGARPLGSS